MKSNSKCFISSDDLEYWKIDDVYLETCCQTKYNTRKDAIEDEMRKEATNLKKEEPEFFAPNKCGR